MYGNSVGPSVSALIGQSSSWSLSLSVGFSISHLFVSLVILLVISLNWQPIGRNLFSLYLSSGVFLKHVESDRSGRFMFSPFGTGTVAFF